MKEPKVDTGENEANRSAENRVREARSSKKGKDEAGNRIDAGAGMAAASAALTMIKSTFTFIAILSLLAATSAFAKTMKLPGDEFPIASIAFPDDWAPEEVTNGAAGESPDTAVYLAAVAVG